MDIQKCTIKIESRSFRTAYNKHAVSAQEQRIAPCKSSQQLFGCCLPTCNIQNITWKSVDVCRLRWWKWSAPWRWQWWWWLACHWCLRLPSQVYTRLLVRRCSCARLLPHCVIWREDCSWLLVMEVIWIACRWMDPFHISSVPTQLTCWCLYQNLQFSIMFDGSMCCTYLLDLIWTIILAFGCAKRK